MKMTRIHILLLLIAVTGISLLSFCGSNSYHRSQAAALLTMGDCLGCHNGSPGKAVHVCIGKECLFSGNHSLMSSYPPIGKESSYAPLADVEKAGCLLEDGKITCLSCHNLTLPPPHLIKEGDDLCHICHIGQ